MADVATLERLSTLYGPYAPQWLGLADGPVLVVGQGQGIVPGQPVGSMIHRAAAWMVIQDGRVVKSRDGGVG